MTNPVNDNPLMNIEISADERRRHDRSRLIVDLHFDGGDATGIASTQDISVGGLYMNTSTELPIGAKLLLRIPFESDQLVVRGEVVYSNGGRGVGVQFIDMNEQAKATLARLLQP